MSKPKYNPPGSRVTKYLEEEACPECESTHTIVAYDPLPGVAVRSCPLCGEGLGEA